MNRMAVVALLAIVAFVGFIFWRKIQKRKRTQDQLRKIQLRLEEVLKIKDSSPKI